MALAGSGAEWPGTFAYVLRCREQRADLSDGLDVKTRRSYQFREARLGRRRGDLRPSLKPGTVICQKGIVRSSGICSVTCHPQLARGPAKRDASSKTLCADNLLQPEGKFWDRS